MLCVSFLASYSQTLVRNVFRQDDVLCLTTLLPHTRNHARRCSGVLRLIQDFLGKPKDLLADEMALTPALCDQKRAELLLYKLLNQVDSPAARLKVRAAVPRKRGGA